MARLRRPAPKTLRAVHPNVGLTVEYRRRLLKLVDEMNTSVQYWIKAAYRQNEPAMALDAILSVFSSSNEDEKSVVMALDATPAAEMQRAVRKMIRQWQRRFNKGADDLADFFAKAARSRSDRQLQAILRDAGFSVKFTITPAMRDVMRATVEQNVQLIKSIPQQYLTQVQGAVMRSVQTGRDLASLANELQEQFGVTRRRAALIARDQNAKATSAMQKVRQVELGIQEGIWMHSHAGKVPRPTHLANDRKRFNLATGWFDPDPKVRRHIMPGELINCRCVWKPVIPGFS